MKHYRILSKVFAAFPYLLSRLETIEHLTKKHTH